MARQCEYSKAAAIMVKILEIVGIKREAMDPGHSFALELVPALLEEYLMLCGIGEFAPTEVGGSRRPYTRMMGLFYAIYDIYEKRKALAHDTAIRVMESEAGVIAIEKVVAEIVAHSFDDREFRALRVGESETGLAEMALVASGRTTGAWPDCLNIL